MEQKSERTSWRQLNVDLLAALGVADTGDISGVELLISGREPPKLVVCRAVLQGNQMVQRLQELALGQPLARPASAGATAPADRLPEPPASA